MNVKLKLTINQLTEIVKAIQQDRVVAHPVTIEEKANHYLFENAFKRLLKKLVDKTGANKKGLFSITLSYPEAAIIWSTINQCNCQDNYRISVLDSFNFKLHQTLQSL